MSLKQIEPPTAMAVSSADAKSWIRVDTDDDNSLINELIDAGIHYIENATNRQLVTATWRLKLATFPNNGGDLIMTVSPLQSVTSVTYVNTSDEVTTWDAANYVVDTDSNVGRLRPAYNIDYPSDVRGYDQDVVVTFIAGYGDAATDVPCAASTAIKLLVGNWYENRESNAPISLQPVPMALQALIWQFKDGTIQ